MANTREHISLRLSEMVMDAVRAEIEAFQRLTGVKRSIASVIEMRLMVAYHDHPVSGIGPELNAVLKAPLVSMKSLISPASVAHSETCKCLMCKPPKP